MNTQEFGKFVAYKDAVLIMSFIEGRGLYVHDFSKHQNHGLVKNMKWLKGVGYFNGHNSYVAYPIVLQPSLSDVTITSWSKPLVLDSIRQVVYHGQGGEIYLGSYANSYKAGCKLANAIWYDVESLTKEPNVYIFATNIYKRVNSLNILINGVLENSITLPNYDLNNAIGYLPSIGTHSRGRVTNQYFLGYISFVSIYTKALSESENKSVYYYSNPNKRPKPTTMTRRGCYQAVKNTGIEVDGNMVRCHEVM